MANLFVGEVEAPSPNPNTLSVHVHELDLVVASAEGLRRSPQRPFEFRPVAKGSLARSRTRFSPYVKGFYEWLDKVVSKHLQLPNDGIDPPNSRRTSSRRLECRGHRVCQIRLRRYVN